MARGINKAIILGTLGSDPQTGETHAGMAVCNISVATNESWKDKNTGEKVEKTEWHRITLYGKLADIASNYLTKSSQVYIEGRIQTRKWTDDKGVDRYTTEIIAKDMQMLGGKTGSDSSPRAPTAPGPDAPRIEKPADAPTQADGFDDVPF